MSAWRKNNSAVFPWSGKRLIPMLALSVTAWPSSRKGSRSIGISLFPDHGNTAELLLRQADMALQAAKRTGGGTAQIYSPALGRQSQRAAEMAGALLDAVAKSQFRMVYQPVFSADGEIAAF